MIETGSSDVMEIMGKNKKHSHLSTINTFYCRGRETAHSRYLGRALVDNQNVCGRSLYFSGNYQGLFCRRYRGAVREGLVDLNVFDVRDYAYDAHKTVDDVRTEVVQAWS